MALSYPASLLAVGGAKTGIAPVNLLDVQDVNGNTYFWSDRKISAPNGLQQYASIEVNVPGDASPWSLASGMNPEYPFGNGQGAAPVVAIKTSPGDVLYITAAGIVQYANLGVAGPDGDGAPTGTAPFGGLYFPTLYMPGSKLATGGLCGAFTDAAGNVIAPVSIGSSATLVAPAMAAQLQLGINDTALAGNSRSFTVTIASSALGAVIEEYSPWLLEVPEFAFHRSLQTDVGSFVIQNISGDTLSRDTEKLLRASTLEGAIFVYRLWQADAEAAWLEVHGQLTADGPDVDTVTLKGSQLINGQEDTPLETYCETCQIDWAGKRCGSTQPTECSYSFQTCQVVERIMVVMNDYEKNFGEATANVATKVINRRRRI